MPALSSPIRISVSRGPTAYQKHAQRASDGTTRYRRHTVDKLRAVLRKEVGTNINARGSAPPRKSIVPMLQSNQYK